MEIVRTRHIDGVAIVVLADRAGRNAITAAAPPALVREIKEMLHATPGLPDHAGASEYELVRQLASIERAGHWAGMER